MLASFKISDVDLCRIIRIDITSIYVHWVMSNLTRDMLEDSFLSNVNNMKRVCVVYDITGIHFNGHNAHRFKEYDIPVDETCLFIEELEPHRTYIADIGFKTEENLFYAVLRSNSVYLPPATEVQFSLTADKCWIAAEESEPLWMDSFSAYSCYTNELNKVNKKDE